MPIKYKPKVIIGDKITYETSLSTLYGEVVDSFDSFIKVKWEDGTQSIIPAQLGSVKKLGK